MVKIEIKESVKFQDNKSAFVSFNYRPEIVSIIRELPFKYYNAETTTWEIPVSKVSHLIEKLKGYEITLCGDISALVDKKISKLPTSFKFKTKPYEHQIDGVEYGLKYDKWFLGDEQGLGKTKQVIDIAVARKIQYHYKHCLIVCGVNTLKWNWVNEILTHSEEGAWILGQRTNKSGKIKIGSMSNKLDDLDNLYSEGNIPYFLITNVESFRNDDFSKKVADLCKKGIINMCAADEMHKMKNPTAQQTKGFLKCLTECRIGMTGTPLMNSPMDLYVILKWLGFESHSYYSFKQHYCVMGGYGGYEIVGYKNMEQLTAQVREIMLRRLKSEVLDLPEKTYVDEFVEMTDKQSMIYTEVEKEIKANIDQIKFDNNPLATLIRLRQATGYTGILSSSIQESAKIDRMIDIVEESISNNRKVIIFSNWTQITGVISEKIKEIGWAPLVITGETRDEDRQLYVKMFQERDNNPVIIGTIGAMGTGLTLTAATTVIFMDEPWNKALFDQAVDRAHRIGQKNNITIYSIMCKDTIDERIHNLIYKKGAMSDAIIDGKIVGNKTDILNYLIG